MALKGKIEENLKTSLKGKKELEVSVLRMLKAAILNKEKEKRYKLSKPSSRTLTGVLSDKTPFPPKADVKVSLLDKEKPELAEKKLEEESALGDEEIIGVISTEIKKRKEAIVLFERGKREDLVKKETAEMEILQAYLPEQITEEELKKLVKAAVEKVGAKEMRDFGKVMQELMPQVKGKADGGVISKIVKELLEAE